MKRYRVLYTLLLISFLTCFSISGAGLVVAATGSGQALEKVSSKPHVAVLFDEKFLLHNTGPNHPERPERLKFVISHLKENKPLAHKLYWPTFNSVPTESLLMVHSLDYIKLVEAETQALGGHDIKNLSTGDTVISTHTLEAAKLAVGAGIAGADEVMARRATSAFAIVRPPGHHATRSRGMGFCVFNNIAITAKHLQMQYGLKRILIVDFDVHHGNGTQDIFYDDDTVFYFSVHQHPFYPGTGRQNETGTGKGKGYTLNVDLPAGSGDEAILSAINQKLKPAMETFKPEFILISAGIDAHEGDQLGMLNYTGTGYTAIAKTLREIANNSADGRMVYMLEGGYSPENITNAVTNILTVLTETQ
jgi:acetoin utilization deacetylase AcuC-like enzyme